MNTNGLSRPYTDRSNCRRAATRECGGSFEIEAVEGGFAFRRLPATRFPGAAKAAAELTPGLKRLRAASNAEELRESALADQAKEAERRAAKATPKFVTIDKLMAKTSPIAATNEASWPAPKTGKRAAILAAAQAGNMPTPPDFSAETHARFRGKLAALMKLVEAGDIAGLKAYAINPVSSSPKALDKYRNLCVIALEARAQKKAA